MKNLSMVYFFRYNINKLIKRVRLHLIEKANTTLLKSTPTGEVYDLVFDPKQRERSKISGDYLITTNIDLGKNVHQASRLGQPPAILTGDLKKSIGTENYGLYGFKFGAGDSVINYVKDLEVGNGDDIDINRSIINRTSERSRQDIDNLITSIFIGEM